MNKASLKDIFDNVINPEAQKLLNNNDGLYFLDNAFEVLWSEYSVLHDYYSKKHLHPDSNGVDVHKEVSIIAIALLKVRLLKTLSSDYYGNNVTRYAFNETLAFLSACGVLYTVLLCDYEENDCEMSREEADFSMEFLRENGLLFPQTKYQSYVQNSITEFYFTSREGSYSFLGLADKFFLLEYLNKEHIKRKYKERTK